MSSDDKWGSIRAASEKVKAKRESGGGSWTNWFKLPNDGDEAIVRFINVRGAWCCEVPPSRSGQKYNDWVPVIDQDQDGAVACPATERGLDTKFVVWISLIRRDAPKFKLDKEGKYVKDANGNLVQDGVEDQVQIWEQGIQTAELLMQVDGDYKGLQSRDFRIRRNGTGFNTKYTIVAADVDAGTVPMSEADEELASQEAADVNRFATPMNYDDLLARIEGRQTSSQQQEDDEQRGRVESANVFARRREASA